MPRKIRYFSVDFSFVPKAVSSYDIDYEEQERILSNEVSDREILIIKRAKELNVPVAHEYGWMDGSLYLYVRGYKNLRKLLVSLWRDKIFVSSSKVREVSGDYNTGKFHQGRNQMDCKVWELF